MKINHKDENDIEKKITKLLLEIKLNDDE